MNAAQSGDSQAPGGPSSGLRDIPEPLHGETGVALSGPPISPMARISLYDDVQWELFILEWVHALRSGYVQVKRFGGAGDRGADIAAFKTANGLEGAWDCFQCKHYAEPLALGDILPEILKIFVATVVGECVLPDSYHILAPRGCSTNCGRMLSSPQKLRKKFLDHLADDDSTLARGLESDLVSSVQELASVTDFSMFRSVELTDVLELHKTTCWYSDRFATALQPRPAHVPAPGDLATHERRYVQQLVDVYAEAHPEESLQPESVASNPRVGERFRRHRENFYKAEALRVYARDSVPPGTFERLQDDIHSGVIDVVEDHHATGLRRLTSVLSLVGQLDLSRHRLISVVEIDDRQGMCHQLANVDRIQWMSRNE